MYEIHPRIQSYVMAKENRSKFAQIGSLVLLVSRISLEDFLSVTVEKMQLKLCLDKF